MALTRRAVNRVSGSIWPGFVDAMTALLMVLMFVLTIFMVVQFVLRETISGQESELNQLAAQVAELADALGLERQHAADLEGEIGRLTLTLTAARQTSEVQASIIAQLTAANEAQAGQLADLRANITSFEAQVATLLAERDQAREHGAVLSASLAELEAEKARLISEEEALNLALARARDEIDAAAEAARLAAAKREAMEALIADLQATAAERDASLAAALARLDKGEAEAASVRDQLATALAQLSDTRSAQLAEADAAEMLRQKLADMADALSEGEAARLAQLATVEALRQRLAEVEASLSDEEAQRLAEAAAAEALRQRLADTEGRLTEEEAARLAEAAAAAALREKLKNAEDELTAMTLALEEQRKRAEDTLTMLAAAKAVEGDLNTKLAAALLELETLHGASTDQDQLREDLAAALAARLAAERNAEAAMSDAEKRAALLAAANEALAKEQAVSAEGLRKMALLNEQMASLRAQLGALQAILDEADERDKASQVQIEALGSKLNAALAQVASEERRRAELEEAERKRLEQEAARLEAEAKELERYRSDFFGKLREILADFEGVRIVGDRFVFSSEVLFESGSVDLSDEGKAQIAGVVRILSEVAGRIPEGIDWVLRVDGHTDNVPLAPGAPFTDNWDLSQGRALSVVRYMIDDLGFAPGRLVPAGFGEYHPIAQGNTPEARAQNRRIELKLTER